MPKNTLRDTLGGMLVGAALLLLHPAFAERTSANPLPSLDTGAMQAQINALKSDVAGLQATNTALKAQVSKLEGDLKLLGSAFSNDSKQLHDLAKQHADLKTAYSGHKHPYTYQSVTYWNRPFFKDVKGFPQQFITDLASYIESMPLVNKSTGTPVP